MKNTTPSMLFLLNNAPNATQELLMAALAEDAASTTVQLNGEDLDYARLLDQIFTADKVVCWW